MTDCSRRSRVRSSDWIRNSAMTPSEAHLLMKEHANWSVYGTEGPFQFVWQAGGGYRDYETGGKIFLATTCLVPHTLTDTLATKKMRGV